MRNLPSDIIGDETVAQLIARGLTKRDAVEARAFALFLRGVGSTGSWSNFNAKANPPAALYAVGQLSGTEFLEAVARDELLEVDPDWKAA